MLSFISARSMEYKKLFTSPEGCDTISMRHSLISFQQAYVFLVKTYASISCLLGMNCVATEVELRFSVRSFGCALFILEADAMDTDKISEETYKQAFETLSFAVNEAVCLIMTALAECEDVFLKTIEQRNETFS